MGLEGKAPNQNVSEIYALLSTANAALLGQSTVTSNRDYYLQWPPNLFPCINACLTPVCFSHTQWPR